MKCVLCKDKIDGYGNNPAPLNNGEGKCCDKCNRTYVIPARIMEVGGSTI